MLRGRLALLCSVVGLATLFATSALAFSPLAALALVGGVVLC